MQDKFFLPTTIFICLILLIGWQQFIYEPAQREILNLELETRRLNELEREISNLKARHGNLSAFIEEKEFELYAARKFLPSTPAQDKFIDEIYRAAEFDRIQILSVQTGEIIKISSASRERRLGNGLYFVAEFYTRNTRRRTPYQLRKIFCPERGR